MSSVVTVLRTAPATVLDDYQRLAELSGLKNKMDASIPTMIKLNLSWTLYYPACSTEPWQLEGAVRSLKNAGFSDLKAVENQTVVTQPWKGAYLNRWLPVLKREGVEFQPLTDVEWVEHHPKAEMIAMGELFDTILVPKMFLGSNMVHLPTVKTHGHTTTTGAMKNAFGGLIPKYRHHAHKKIHEVLVDLLAIQKEIHPGIFAMMDGSVCGDGAGPRTMDPYIGNVILASDDQVAIDAVAARIMGFDPLSIDYIRLADERGLGTGDLDQIEVIGMDGKEATELNFHFCTKKSPIIRWDQRIRKSTASNPRLHRLLFHSSFFRTFITASEVYHDRFWYPVIGRKNISRFETTEWGKLLATYELGDMPDRQPVKEWDPY